MAAKRGHPTDRHVGARVRMRRKMLGWSQTKLAEALGLTFQQVQKYEKGSNRIGSSRLQELSNVLEVPVAFFFENGAGRTAAPVPDYIDEFLASSDGLGLTKAYMRIKDTKIRRRIRELVEQIAAD